MMRVYAAMAQKEREVISERTRLALAAARAGGARLGDDRGYRPAEAPDASAAARAREHTADQIAHRLMREVAQLRAAGVTSLQGLARALTERGMPMPRAAAAWTHAAVARLVTGAANWPATRLLQAMPSPISRQPEIWLWPIAA